MRFGEKPKILSNATQMQEYFTEKCSSFLRCLYPSIRDMSKHRDFTRATRETLPWKGRFKTGQNVNFQIGYPFNFFKYHFFLSTPSENNTVEDLQ